MSRSIRHSKDLVTRVAHELRNAAGGLQARAPGNRSKRSAAARKAAATRKRNAAERSAKRS